MANSRLSSTAESVDNRSGHKSCQSQGTEHASSTEGQLRL